MMKIIEADDDDDEHYEDEYLLSVRSDVWLFI